MKPEELAKITKDAKPGTFIYGDALTFARRYNPAWGNPAWGIEMPGHGEDGLIELIGHEWEFKSWATIWTEAQLREVVAVLGKLNEAAKGE